MLCHNSLITCNGKTNIFILENFITRRFLNLEHTTKAEASKRLGLLPSISPLPQEDHEKGKTPTLIPKAQIHPNELRKNEGPFKLSNLLSSLPKAMHHRS